MYVCKPQCAAIRLDEPQCLLSSFTKVFPMPLMLSKYGMKTCFSLHQKKIGTP